MGAWSNKEFGAVRREYELSRMDELKLPDDPILLFVEWIEKAGTSGIPDPTAMTLSTVDEQGSPSSRIVLLKKIDQNRLIFFTNYRSRKAKEIRNNPRVAAHFYWPELERQVKISGVAQTLEDLDSDLYFSSRPFESKVAAWASPQSEVVPDRELPGKRVPELPGKIRRIQGVSPDQPTGVGLPSTPSDMEFWQGGMHRLHDRIDYTKKEERLEPCQACPLSFLICALQYSYLTCSISHFLPFLFNHQSRSMLHKAIIAQFFLHTFQKTPGIGQFLFQLL